MTTGQWIKKLRGERKYTQKKLAHLAELSTSELSLIENVKRSPSTTTLCLLADALNTTTDYLLCRTDTSEFIMTQTVPNELRKQIEFVMAKYELNKEKGE